MVPAPDDPALWVFPTVLDAAALITTDQCEVVLIAAGGAGIYVDRSSAAPWTRPANELVVGYGLFTAAEFALMARRHMVTYGTTPEQLAAVAATIRTNGHANPDAVYRDRGPFSPADILASRMIADPFHLLDCAMTSEGGCGIVLVAASGRPNATHRSGSSGEPVTPSGPRTRSHPCGTSAPGPTAIPPGWWAPARPGGPSRWPG